MGLLERFEIDPAQLCALLGAEIKNQFRHAAPGGELGDRAIRSGFGFMLATYFLSSIVLTAFVPFFSDQLAYDSIVLAYSMGMIAFAVLVKYHELTLNADDLEILMVRPISSATVFCSRLLLLGFYVLLFSASILMLPSLAALRFSWEQAHLLPLTFAVRILACLASAFLVVAAYSYLLKRVDPARIVNAITLFQMASACGLFYIYHKFVLYRQRLDAESVQAAVQTIKTIIETRTIPAVISFDENPYFFFLPSSWFATLVALIQGDTSTRNLICSGLAGFSLILGLAVGFRFSRAHFGNLFNLSLGGNPEAEKPGTGDGGKSSTADRIRRFAVSPLLGSAQARAGFTLISAYLRRDGKLMRGVYPFLGIMVFYFFLAFENPRLVLDMFTATSPLHVVSSHAVFILLPVCVMIALDATRYYDRWQAAWIFFCSPLDVRRFYAGYRAAVLCWVYMPLALIQVAIYSLKMPFSHALLQSLATFLIICLLDTFNGVLDPRLPLSQPPRSHEGAIRLTLVALALLVLSGSLLLAEYYAAKNTATTPAFYLGLGLLVTLMKRIELNRAERLLGKAE